MIITDFYERRKTSDALISDSELEVLLSTLDIESDANDSKLAHNRNKAYQRNKLTKAAATAQAARSSLLAMTAKNAHICNNIANTLNLNTFKETFFTETHHQEYERLNPLVKILLSQYLIHNQQNTTLKGYPFVYRLSLTQRPKAAGNTFNKQLQRKISTVLKRPVLFWTYKEYDGDGYRNPNKIITHINGEILITSNELQILKEAFKKLAGGTKTINPSLPYTIRFPVGSRNKNTARHGNLYSVCNWCAYAAKQDKERLLDYRRTCFDYQLQRKPIPAPDKEKFYYISQKLNNDAKAFYNEKINKSAKE